MVNGSWDESLETGNEMIDSQHRQLLNLLDEVKDDFKSHNNVLRILDKVTDLTMTHFLCEEELMTKVNYPSDTTKKMIEQHKTFKSYLRLRILEFRQGEKLTGQPLQSFIVNYLKDHEFKADRQLVNWIHKQNETSEAA